MAQNLNSKQVANLAQMMNYNTVLSPLLLSLLLALGGAFTTINYSSNKLVRSRFSCMSATKFRMARDDNQNKKKKSIQDRSQAETLSLIQDIVQAAVEAGPRAAPTRTLQAYLAFSRTGKHS